MFAIIETGGKQYRVAPGDRLRVEKLDVNNGENLVFDKVLLLSDDKDTKIGTPHVKGAKVEAKVLDNGRSKKVVVFKYKAKKRYRKKHGHRQPFTQVQIDKISSS